MDASTDGETKLPPAAVVTVSVYELPTVMVAPVDKVVIVTVYNVPLAKVVDGDPASGAGRMFSKRYRSNTKCASCRVSDYYAVN